MTKTVREHGRPATKKTRRFFVLRTFTVFCCRPGRGRGGGRIFAPWTTRGSPNAQPDFAARRGTDRRHQSRHPLRRQPGLLPPPDAGRHFPEPQRRRLHLLPPKATFDPPGAFYETATHELAHWSEPRTGWDHDKNGYALGELAAEIASCYVSAELGIPQGEGLGNHAAYLRSWLEGLKGDRNYIFKASRQASKVTDFLLGFVKKPEPVAVQETVT